MVVLGDQAAKMLGVTRLESAPAVFIGDRAYTVIGILGDLRREQILSTAVIVPPTVGADFGLKNVTRVLVNTTLGAADLIAGQAPVALSPNHPGELQVIAPPSPKRARDGVQDDVNGLFLILGLVSLVVGAVGIANVTLVTVMERVAEIGLRCSLGAARRHVAAQFLLESTLIGMTGGVIGASLGLVAVVVISAAKEWTPSSTSGSRWRHRWPEPSSASSRASIRRCEPPAWNPWTPCAEPGRMLPSAPDTPSRYGRTFSITYAQLRSGLTVLAGSSNVHSTCDRRTRLRRSTRLGGQASASPGASCVLSRCGLWSRKST